MGYVRAFLLLGILVGVTLVFSSESCREAIADPAPIRAAMRALEAHAATADAESQALLLEASAWRTAARAAATLNLGELEHALESALSLHLESLVANEANLARNADAVTALARTRTWRTSLVLHGGWAEESERLDELENELRALESVAVDARNAAYQEWMDAPELAVNLAQNALLMSSLADVTSEYAQVREDEAAWLLDYAQTLRSAAALEAAPNPSHC